MHQPRTWTEEELGREVLIAKENFRRVRLEEPLELWRETFARYRSDFERLFGAYPLATPESVSGSSLADIFQDGLGDALRYLAGPPISADDLKVLAEASSLSPSYLRANPPVAERLVRTILSAADPARFPWITEGRDPADEEIAAAILASAVLLTAQRVATSRRMSGKASQEEAVKAFLRAQGFAEVERRRISTLGDAPGSGQFCGEATVGSRSADITARLHDGRILALECKVSNSALNSIKRVNNDAAVKAATWRQEFGTRNIVPAAVLSGVFDARKLFEAQDLGLALFWEHRFEDLGAFLADAR